MGSNGVVSIRVEALGVSITIAEGSIAIEQTKTELPAASKAEGPAASTSEAVPTSDVVTERVAPFSKGLDDSAFRGEQTPRRPSPSARNGPPGLPGTSGKGQKARSGQTKPVWSDEEVEKLTALWPTHSARAIATQLGRGFTAVRSKAQHLGLRKAARLAGTALPDSQEIPVRAKRPSPREAKPATKPKPLSAAVTADPAPAGTGSPGFPGDSGTALRAVPDGFSAVSLFDRHPGQCRWIISDVWPVIYCGAPVVDSSSWCEQHSRRVFTHDGDRQRWTARGSKEPDA
jgi:hypothetical protein